MLITEESGVNAIRKEAMKKLQGNMLDWREQLYSSVIWKGSHDEEVETLEEVDVLSERENELVVFNDDVNTFDHVIRALIEICNHTAEQAEQCTLIIHYKGKCAVKNGTYEELVPMRNAICDRGISAEVV